ncbi:MAG: MBL fold metallo-hydrolase [Planctomycetes bacterium]|nr:MBL fold metallo-hydrolase [Planctomycetota bacterium]
MKHRCSGSRPQSSPRSVTMGRPNGLTSPWEPDDLPLKPAIYRRAVALSASGCRPMRTGAGCKDKTPMNDSDTMLTATRKSAMPSRFQPTASRRTPPMFLATAHATGLAVLGIDFGDLALILRTHIHSDHFGNTAGVAQRARCPVSYHLRSVPGRPRRQRPAPGDRPPWPAAGPPVRPSLLRPGRRGRHGRRRHEARRFRRGGDGAPHSRPHGRIDRVDSRLG